MQWRTYNCYTLPMEMIKSSFLWFFIFKFMMRSETYIFSNSRLIAISLAWKERLSEILFIQSTWRRSTTVTTIYFFIIGIPTRAWDIKITMFYFNRRWAWKILCMQQYLDDYCIIPCYRLLTQFIYFFQQLYYHFHHNTL